MATTIFATPFSSFGSTPNVERRKPWNQTSDSKSQTYAAIAARTALSCAQFKDEDEVVSIPEGLFSEFAPFFEKRWVDILSEDEEKCQFPLLVKMDGGMRNRAATKVQSMWRGYIARHVRAYLHALRPPYARLLRMALSIACSYSDVKEKLVIPKKSLIFTADEKLVEKREVTWTILEYKAQFGKLPSKYESQIATKVQALWRGYMARLGADAEDVIYFGSIKSVCPGWRDTGILQQTALKDAERIFGKDPRRLTGTLKIQKAFDQIGSYSIHADVHEEACVGEFCVYPELIFELCKLAASHALQQAVKAKNAYRGPSRKFQLRKDLQRCVPAAVAFMEAIKSESTRNEILETIRYSKFQIAK